METFNNILKTERIKRGLVLRQVAAGVEIDQAIISKYEKGIKRPTKEQVIKFAQFFKINEQYLITAWLSDKILYEISDENNPIHILKVAEEKFNYIKKEK